MKKIWMILLSLMLVLTIASRAYASEGALTVADAEAVPGDVVYLTVKLTESVVGDSVAVSYSFDASVLEPLTDLHTWVRSGALQGFELDHAGVWASMKAEELKGDVCILAFRVHQDAALTETKVQCVLSVKNGGADAGRYTAEAKVYKVCEHSYGAWVSSTSLEHSRTCVHCGNIQTKSHKWDGGAVSDKPGNPYIEVVTYTCSICADSYTEERDKDQTPTVPTIGEITPATKPTEEITVPTTEPAPPNTVAPPDWDFNRTEATAPPAVTAPNTSGVQGGSKNPSQNASQNTSQNPSGNKGNSSDATTQSTEATKSYHDYNAPTAGNDHDNAEKSTEPPVAIPGLIKPQVTDSTGESAGESAAEAESESAHDHDHVHEAGEKQESAKSGNPTVTALAVFAVLAVVVGGAMFYVKKK